MHYIEAFDRNQMVMTSWYSLVEPESTARLIDAFVNSLKCAFFACVPYQAVLAYDLKCCLTG
ncbi:MAG: hypothetical protein K6G19_12070 [Lachnospiraceae bacterium]|nr:hypothetical protein [Lachnospiraceae bacterium]